LPRTKCAYIDPHTKLQCHRESKYMMRLTLHGETEPRYVLVCATCDKQQGRKTLTEKCGWSLDDAIKWEKNPERTPDMLESKDRLTHPSISSTAAAAAVRHTRAVISNTRY
jgi:hypothetical protein